MTRRILPCLRVLVAAALALTTSLNAPMVAAQQAPAGADSGDVAAPADGSSAEPVGPGAPDPTLGEGSGEGSGAYVEALPPGPSPEEQLAALREAARLAAENLRLVTGTASAAVDLAVRSGQIRLASREARRLVDAAVAPARFAVETEEQRIVLLQTALHAAGGELRRAVEVARVRSWSELVQTLANRRAAQADARELRAAEQLDLAATVAERLGDPEQLASPDALYTELVDELESARAELWAALDANASPSSLPPRLRRPIPEDLATAYPSLVAQHEQALAVWTELTTSEPIERHARIERAAEVVFALNEARLALLPELSRASRERVLGLGAAGLAQARREVQHLRLLARWYRYDRSHRVDAVSDRIVECLTVASLRFSLMRLALVLTLAMVLLRQREAWLQRIERWVAARSADGQAPHWWPPTRGTLPDVIVLVAVVLLVRELAVLAPVAEVELLSRVAGAIATYRLVLSGTHQTLLWAAASAYVPVSDELSSRFRRSLRLAGRVAIAIAVYLIIAEELVGRGYLYRVVRQSAWVLAFPVAWWILRSWSRDVLDLYQRRLPNGALAPLVRRFGSGPLRSLLVVPAGVPLLYRAAIIGARATAYRFERSRKALSYLFLRQLERRQASRGQRASGRELEPEIADAIVAPLRPDEVTDVWPKAKARVAEHLRRWRDDAEFGSVAVIGERGVGKSAFVASLLTAESDTAVSTIPLSLRAVEPDVLLSELASAVGAAEDSGPEALVSTLLEGPRRIVVVDDVHRCVRRAIGCQEAYLQLQDLIARTGHHVYWVCTYGAFAWRWFLYAMEGRALHALVIRLEPWPDAAIERLIRGRMDALGLREQYDGLIEEAGSAEARAIQLLETRDDFFRLVRDHADGIPRAALGVWASALFRHVDGSVQVQPLDTWEADDLEFLDEDGRFVLGAIVAQVDIEQDMLARVLRLPEERVGVVLARLRHMGVVTASGRGVRIAENWQRAAVAFSRRKQLIAPG